MVDVYQTRSRLPNMKQFTNMEGWTRPKRDKVHAIERGASCGGPFPRYATPPAFASTYGTSLPLEQVKGRCAIARTYHGEKTKGRNESPNGSTSDQFCYDLLETLPLTVETLWQKNGLRQVTKEGKGDGTTKKNKRFPSFLFNLLTSSSNRFHQLSTRVTQE